MLANQSISVVIPAYNAEAYLHCAIASVMAQTRQANEIVVVDDGSTDATANIAASFTGVRLIRKPHSGIAATRNLGVASSHGRYLAFLDADDLWLPQKLELQLACLEQQGADAVFGKLQQFVSPDLAESERARYQCDPQPLAGASAGCLLIERDTFLKIGLFDESLAAGEFIEWMIRAKQQTLAIPAIEAVVLLRRIHGQNTVLADVTGLHQAYLSIVRRKLKGRSDWHAFSD